VATVRQRKPGVWEVRVFTGRDESGRPTQASRTVRGTKREAQRVAASLESRAPSRAAGRTVEDVLRAWEEVNESVWSPSSRRDYGGRVRAILADPIAAVGLGRISVADVERWHARMRRAGVGPQAVRNRHSVLRAALAQAVRWGWLGANVAAAARLRQARQTARESMTVDEVQEVIAAAATIDPAAALALRLAAVAGLRRAELAGVRWDDVADDRLTVDSSIARHVEADGSSAFVDAPTKTANRRVVRLDADTLAAFESVRAAHGGVSPYVFSLGDGPPPPSRIGWWWTRARTLAGIDRRWRLHDLRHWSATMAIGAGHDVRTVAGRLGHANPAMTLRVYAHAVEAADEAVANMLGRLLVPDSDG
jgi:integrase